VQRNLESHLYGISSALWEWGWCFRLALLYVTKHGFTITVLKWRYTPWNGTVRHHCAESWNGSLLWVRSWHPCFEIERASWGSCLWTPWRRVLQSTWSSKRKLYTNCKNASVEFILAETCLVSHQLAHTWGNCKNGMVCSFSFCWHFRSSTLWLPPV
jgi:hypothetical protein